MFFLLLSLLTHKVDSFHVKACVRLNQDFLFQKALVPVDVIREHCQQVSDAVERYPWSIDVLEVLALNDVAPFTVLTEPPFIDRTKRSIFKSYVDYIGEASNCQDISCIAMELNSKLWDIRDPPIVFAPADSNQLNSYGVEETWERGNGSCTSMSVFLITALRMLGVPSRLVGVPHWNLGVEKCPFGDASPACGNHNWVEVFVAGQGWSFIDQRRPDEMTLPLNQSWFFPDWTKNLYPNNGNHSIYAVSFLNPFDLDPEYPIGDGVLEAEHFPMVWDWNNHQIPAWDVSGAYQSYEEEEESDRPIIKSS